MKECICDNRYKAIDTAKWANFIERTNDNVVCSKGKGKFEVKAINPTRRLPSMWLNIVPDTYAKMDYDHISYIYGDSDPLQHMEAIRSLFSLATNQVLRFILAEHIPLEKFIRMELASRGRDHQDDFVGHEWAKKVWLK